MTVSTISADQIAYRNGRPTLAGNRPEHNQSTPTQPAHAPRRWNQPFAPVQGFGDKGPRGWKCRAHQLQARLDLVSAGCPVALDCEGMILDGEVGANKRGLGRFSAVNMRGQVALDTFCYYPADVPHRPDPQWLNLGVKYNDIKPENGAQPVVQVLAQVQAIIDKAGIVVVHAGKNDFQMLRDVDFSRVQVYDTQTLSEYIQYARRDVPSLSTLSSAILGETIQTGKDGHSSVEDAQATMKLFLARRSMFEREQGPRPVPSVSTASATTAAPTAAAQGQLVVPLLPRIFGRRVAAVPPTTPAPGHLVALPMIQEFAFGRSFDYRTSLFF